jgi:membrane protein DedA with SNARE-associated domain
MAEWIANVITSLGYLGIAFLMFLENLFPPIPSELIMPLAGFTVARGEMNLWAVLLAGILGTVVGAIVWYEIGTVFGREKLAHWTDRYGQWTGITGGDILKATRWFERYGYWAVFLCRLVPGVRTLISIPAGINHMKRFPFWILTSLGTALWTAFLTGAGYALGENYEKVDEYLGPISKIVLVGLGIGGGVWIIRTILAKKILKR